MHVERIASLGAAAKLREEWNRLAGDVPFRRWEWLGAWWEQYGEPEEGFALAVWRTDGGLAALAPWRRCQAPPFGAVVQFLGSGETCSDYLTVLCGDADRAEAIAALAQWLVDASGREDQSSWDMLDLDGASAFDPALSLLLTHLEQHGCLVHQRTEINAWRIPLPENWNGYKRGLSKPNRRRVRVLQERFVDTGLATVHVAATTDELARGWAVLVDLHQRRRRELGQPGCFASDRFSLFARQAAEGFLALGKLELLWIEHESAPLAAQLAFLGADTTFAYQVGINPEKRDQSPGWLVHSESIKRAIAQGRTAFDFLRGDEPYKQHLGARPSPLQNIRVVPPRLGPKMLHSAWLTSGAVKSWIKTGLQRSGLR
jgi:CelD/BcsL family acetyltransferase involved in cellulose biosynthesis